MKGAVQFFLDFLVADPKHGWLVTNPSTSPENFPLAPGNDPFFDEVTMFTSPGTTLTAGSTIDLEILRDLFREYAQASQDLGVDADVRAEVLKARERLAPLQVGKSGALQEWLDDWGQREKSHRHISNLWGVYPGHGITVRDTPALADASRNVLEQRGLVGTGWSSAWKTAVWARLTGARNALDNIVYAVAHYTTDSLFSICSEKLQVDGALGMTAAIAEMLLQSGDGEIDLLPALPSAWATGAVRGLRARGGYEVAIDWDRGHVRRGEITSTTGGVCRVRAAAPLEVAGPNGAVIASTHPEPNVVQFETTAGAIYILRPRQ
jgi:alpha-L-fucosidase 2